MSQRLALPASSETDRMPGISRVTAGLFCSLNCGGDETFSGTGVRPANSNGFTADVGTNSQTWTFDPAGPFKASLSGSAGGGGHCSLVCIPFHKESGKLTVES